MLAANLRRHRNAVGLSQQDLADRAGLSRIGYRDVEAGAATPRIDTLQRIAEALGAKVQDLLVPVRTLTHVRFRAHKRMTTRENVLADAARWVDDYRELEDILDDRIPWALEDVAKQARRLKVDRPRRVAELAREQLGLKHEDREELIRDVCGLLDDHGVKVLTADVKSEGFFGLSVGPEDAGPAVLVNTWDRISVERWIFTAVHELGHLLMHPGAYDVSNADEVDDEEQEADAFAGFFLMPQSLFEKEWEEARGLGLLERVYKVKRIFRVSWQTVLYRVAAPRPAGERRVIWQRFHEQYERVNGRPLSRTEEPDGLGAAEFLSGRPAARAADEPARLSESDFREDRLLRLVRRGVDEQLISLGRAAEILGLQLPAMRELVRAWVG
ncbi:MAG: ImmA/IrrE family metallo-endopeptidase [Deltaproteobacteria bacterium]|nr:ImmA/IrrE family metallo-endopeptidase [Nannocystaceae bacterium]